MLKPLVPTVAGALLTESLYATSPSFEVARQLIANRLSRTEGATEATTGASDSEASALCVAGLSTAELKLVAVAEAAVRAAAAGLSKATEGGAAATDYVPPPLGEALRIFMRVDALLPRRLSSALHTLYLSCLPDPTFKRAFAEAFADMYLSLVVQYANGIGTRDDCLFGFSVQLFTTPSLVHALLPRGLLTRVLLALDYTIHAASVCESSSMELERDARTRTWRASPYQHVPTLDCDAAPLTHRRYEYVVRDLEYILTIDGVARKLATSPPLLRHWLKVLTRLQHADLQLRFLSAHIEHDSRSWIQAFNLHLSLSSSFPVVLKPLTDLAVPPDLTGTAATRPPTPPPDALYLASAMGSVTIRALASWMGQERTQLITLPLPPAAFVSCTVDGSAMASVASHADFSDVGMSRGASFHIPLHRFFAAMIREACAVGDSASACEQVLLALCSASPAACEEDVDSGADAMFETGGRFWSRLAEQPMRVSAFCAQITAGMWRRNGVAMVNQVVNYASAPLCVRLRDLDILLMQTALARLTGPASQPSSDKPAAWREELREPAASEWGCGGIDPQCGFLLALAHKYGIYRWVLLACGAADEAVERAGALKSERAADHAQRLALCEEYLWLVVVIVTELPRPAGAVSLLAQLRREIVHRLAAQPCSRSELSECADVTSHPRLARLPIEAVLRDISVRKLAPTAITSPIPSSRAPRYELKPELASEYDPEFYHLSAQMHKMAAERMHEATALPSNASPSRATPTSSGAASSQEVSPPTPPLQMVAAPPTAHTSFTLVRRLLFAAPMLSLVRSSLARAVLVSMPMGSRQMGHQLPPVDRGLVAAAALLTLSRKRLEAQNKSPAHATPPARAVASGAIGVITRTQPPEQLPPPTSYTDAANANASATGSSAASSSSTPGDSGLADGVWECPLNEAVDAAKTEHSDRLLSRSLHLLTLMMHCASGPDGTNEEASSILTSAQRTSFFRSLTLAHPIAQKSGRECSMINSVLGMLRSLSIKEGPIQRACLWLVQEIRRADSNCASLLDEVDAAERLEAEKAAAERAEAGGGADGSNDTSGRDSRLERKRRAQQRALAQLAKQSERFVESLAMSDADTVSGADTGDAGVVSEGGNGGGFRDAGVVVDPEDPPLCIICHTEDSQPLGFICCAQPSAVLRDAQPPILGGVGGSGSGLQAQATTASSKRSASSSSAATVAPFAFMHQAAHFCGHAVHTECLSHYLRALRERASSSDHFEGRSAIHVTNGEFLCPMCKRASNALVPHLAPSHAELRLAEASLQPEPPTAPQMRALTKEEYTWPARCLRYRETLQPFWPESDPRRREATRAGSADEYASSPLGGAGLDDALGSYDAIAVAHGPAVADRLVCPITQSLMVEPVCTVDGAAYDREAIEAWLREHSTSPATGQSLDDLSLTPNPDLADEIRRLRVEAAAALAAPPAEALDDLWWLRQVALHGFANANADLQPGALPLLPWRLAREGGDTSGATAMALEVTRPSIVDRLCAWLDAPSSLSAATMTAEWTTEPPIAQADTSPWASAWSWQVRPTPARLAAITSFETALKQARGASWAKPPAEGSTPRSSERIPAPPVRTGPGAGAHGGSSEVEVGGGGEGLNCSTRGELLSTLSYTLSARVALFRHDLASEKASSPHKATFSAGFSSVGASTSSAEKWLQLVAELVDSRPLRSLVHATRLSLGKITMRPLLTTGLPAEGEAASQPEAPGPDGVGLAWRVPLLRSDSFDALLIAVLTEAHGTTELWAVVRLCALAAVAREVALFLVEEALLGDHPGQQAGADVSDSTRGTPSEDATLDGLAEGELAELLALLARLAPDACRTTSDALMIIARRIHVALEAYRWRALALAVLITGESVPRDATSPPPAPLAVGEEEAAHSLAINEMLASLGAPTLGQLLLSDRALALMRTWVTTAAEGDHVGKWNPNDVRSQRRSLVRSTPRPLCELPTAFTDLYKHLSSCKCPVTNAFPEEPAICMLCGALLCAGTACCKRDGVGALTQHVAGCSAGHGIFFLVHRTHTVLLRGPHAAYSISPYVDEHGEEDNGLRRGRPLHLDPERMRTLARLWAQHTISGEVVRERVMRDRVVRESFY